MNKLSCYISSMQLKLEIDKYCGKKIKCNIVELTLDIYNFECVLVTLLHDHIFVLVDILELQLQHLAMMKLNYRRIKSEIGSQF